MAALEFVLSPSSDDIPKKTVTTTTVRVLANLFFFSQLCDQRRGWLGETGRRRWWLGGLQKMAATTTARVLANLFLFPNSATIERVGWGRQAGRAVGIVVGWFKALDGGSGA
jgi:hypothetical protein